MRTLEEVVYYFQYHAPDENTRFVHERINDAFANMAELLWEQVFPEMQSSPDKTVMFRKLIEARMAANQAVACHIPTSPATE